MSDVQESSIKIQRLLFPAADVPDDVGDLVAAERRRRRWSQAGLAQRAGISRAAVYRLEAGPRAVRADTLFRIAHALDVPIRTFVPSWPEWDPIKGHGPGEATRERRRALGLTLAELAGRIGVSEATLSRHERGVGTSPTFLERHGDDFAPCNDRLAAELDVDRT